MMTQPIDAHNNKENQAMNGEHPLLDAPLTAVSKFTIIMVDHSKENKKTCTATPLEDKSTVMVSSVRRKKMINVFVDLKNCKLLDNNEENKENIDPNTGRLSSTLVQRRSKNNREPLRDITHLYHPYSKPTTTTFTHATRTRTSLVAKPFNTKRTSLLSSTTNKVVAMTGDSRRVISSPYQNKMTTSNFF